METHTPFKGFRGESVQENQQVCSLCGLALSPMNSQHTSSRGSSTKMQVFLCRCPLEYSRISCPASSTNAEGMGGPTVLMFYLQHCVDVLATLSSLCPGICLAPQQLGLSVFWHASPICCHTPNAPTYLPAAPAWPKQGAKGNSESLRCSPRDAVA